MHELVGLADPAALQILVELTVVPIDDVAAMRPDGPFIGDRLIDALRLKAALAVEVDRSGSTAKAIRYFRFGLRRMESFVAFDGLVEEDHVSG